MGTLVYQTFISKKYVWTWTVDSNLKWNKFFPGRRIRNNEGKREDIEKSYVYLISPTESTGEKVTTLSECPEARLIFHALSPRFGDAAASLVSSVLPHTHTKFLAASAFLFLPFLLAMCQHGPASGCLPIVGKRGCLPLTVGTFGRNTSWDPSSPQLPLFLRLLLSHIPLNSNIVDSNLLKFQSLLQLSDLGPRGTGLRSPGPRARHQLEMCSSSPCWKGWDQNS